MAGELPYHNVKLLMFPDYTMETQRQRHNFDKAALRTKDISYSILFLAKLWVIDGKSESLHQPQGCQCMVGDATSIVVSVLVCLLQSLFCFIICSPHAATGKGRALACLPETALWFLLSLEHCC